MDFLFPLGYLLAWAPTLGLFLITTLVSFSRIFERNPFSFALALSAVFWVWSLTTLSFVDNIAEKKLLYYSQYFALAFIPPFWIGTCLKFTGQTPRTRSFVNFATFSFTGIFALILFFDQHTGWFFRNLTLNPETHVFMREPGPAYYAFLTLLFSSLGFGLVHLARSRSLFSSLDKRRAGIIILAVFVPVLCGLADIFHVFPLPPGIALAPLSTLVSAALLIYGILRAKLLVPVPLAHEILVQQMTDPVVVIGSTQTVDWLNPAAGRMVERRSQTLGQPLQQVFPELKILLQDLRDGSETVVVIDEKEYRVRATVVQDPHSGLEALALVLHDITSFKAEQVRLEQLVEERTRLLNETNQVLESEVVRYQETSIRLERLVAEKELLLQEVHHRVKNNLQIIMSLVNLQSRRIVDAPELISLIDAMKGRIRSISLVHERMYRTSFDNGLDFREYLEELVRGIGSLYGQTGVSLEILPSEAVVRTGVDFSVDFGLVVNELVTNAFKHGIVPSGGGIVTVGLERKNGNLLLIVKDSGTGFPETVKEEGSSSLGLSIVRSILKKYKAELTISPGRDGTTVEVIVPWEER